MIDARPAVRDYAFTLAWLVFCTAFVTTLVVLKGVFG